MTQYMAIPTGVMADSVPPARATTASPRRICSAASPMAWAPDAQALTMAKLGPRAPTSAATIPAGMSTSMPAAAKAETRR